VGEGYTSTKLQPRDREYESKKGGSWGAQGKTRHCRQGISGIAGVNRMPCEKGENRLPGDIGGEEPGRCSE